MALFPGLSPGKDPLRGLGTQKSTPGLGGTAGGAQDPTCIFLSGSGLCPSTTSMVIYLLISTSSFNRKQLISMEETHPSHERQQNRSPQTQRPSDTNDDLGFWVRAGGQGCRQGSSSSLCKGHGRCWGVRVCL